MRALELRDGVHFRHDYPEPEWVSGLGLAVVRPTLTGICRTDLELVAGYQGFQGVLGHEFTGIVEQSDDDTWIGARVVGEINWQCGDCDWCLGGGDSRHCPRRRALGIHDWDGVFADRFLIPQANLYRLPDTVRDEQAVFTEPLAAAIAVLDVLDVQPDTRVLGLGDGRLGLLVAQSLLGHCDLTWGGRHEYKLNLLRRWGVAAFRVEDLHDERYAVVIDCTGSPQGLQAALDHVQTRGRLIVKTTNASERTFDVNRLVVDEITVTGSRCGRFPPALEALADSRVDCQSLISQVFPLEQAVRALDVAAQPGILKVLLRH